MNKNDNNKIPAPAESPWPWDKLIRSVDMVVDVRTPLEYAMDHVPGAVNAWALSDSEDDKVRLAAATSEVAAGDLAANLANANVNQQIDRLMSTLGVGSEVVLYGRGLEELAQVWGSALRRRGVVTRILPGGYQAYRRDIEGRMLWIGDGHEYRVIAGAAGVGKSEVLSALRDAGEQVLDVPELLNQAVGQLGAAWSPGWEIRAFETGLCRAMAKLKQGRPVWLQSGRRQITDERLPVPIQLAVEKNRKVYCLQAPLEERVKRLAGRCRVSMQHPVQIVARAAAQAQHASASEVSHWFQLCQEGNLGTVIRAMLLEEYDQRHSGLVEKMESALDNVIWYAIEPLNDQSFREAALSFVDTDADKR